MSELPNIFKGNVSNNTNQISSIINSNNDYDEKSVKEQIRNIFSSDNFVYKAETIITLTNGETIKKTIIGRTNDSLITLDDELIEVSSITQIRVI